MILEGTFTKMKTEHNTPVDYYLPLNTTLLHVNELIGKNIRVKHIGYECLNCQKKKKIFRQGFCYDCFQSSALVGDWIIKPELSKAHLDIEDRDLSYEKRVQLQPHIVYFSVTSHVKVGVTRKTQVPTRWIDQGASYAFPIVEVPNRYLAGITEVALKDFYSDKTSWQKMLKNETTLFDKKQLLDDVENQIPSEVLPYFKATNHESHEITFPVNNYPLKIKSINLNKVPEFESTLIGIKGQYLIFDDNSVLNVRSHEGYTVEINL